MNARLCDGRASAVTWPLLAHFIDRRHAVSRNVVAVIELLQQLQAADGQNAGAARVGAGRADGGPELQDMVCGSTLLSRTTHAGAQAAAERDALLHGHVDAARHLLRGPRQVVHLHRARSRSAQCTGGSGNM